MKWRVIGQKFYLPSMNMAIDHSIFESVAAGKSLPTIRFYKWEPSSVSIGILQNTSEINLIACETYGIGVVRRMTGGRAVYHDKFDFTYSVIAPMELLGDSLTEAYGRVCSWIIDSLRELGINAYLHNKNDILVDGKKISGNASKSSNGFYLQHGTLVYGIDYGMIHEVLGIPEYLAKKRIASVLEYSKASQNQVYSALKKGFTDGKKFKEGDFSDYELLRSQALARAKYSGIALPHGLSAKNKGVCYVQ